MGTQQRTWWQEMGAISRGMMFIEGTIATPASLQRSERQQSERMQPRRSAQVPERSEPREAQVPGSRRKTRDSSAGLKKQAFHLGRKARWLLEELVLLGGRPMTMRHNDDIDEPFQPLHRKSTRRQHALAVPASRPDSLRECAMR